MRQRTHITAVESDTCLGEGSEKGTWELSPPKKECGEKNLELRSQMYRRMDLLGRQCPEVELDGG